MAQTPPFSALQVAVYAALSGITDGTKATATLTFTGAVANAETVTIGTRVYEFDTAPLPGSVVAGNVRVDVSAGATAPEAVTALVAAITTDASALVTAVDGALDTVVVTAKIYGIAPNSYATTTTCTKAAWGGLLMSGGTPGGTAVGLYSPIAPSTAPLPYVTIGEDFVSDWSTKTSWGTEHLLRVHVWDRGSTVTNQPLSIARTDRIAAQVVARLVDVTLTIGAAAYVCVMSRLASTHLFVEEVGTDIYTHAVVDIRIHIQQA
jgi:hypothetical protein